MIEVPRQGEQFKSRPLGRAATTSRVGTDLTRHTEPFGHAALKEYARSHGTTEVSVVRMAALYYLADRDSGRQAWSVPRFVRHRGASSEAVEDALTAVDGETLGAIEEEAFRQGVSPSVLASHAVLYYLADTEKGRVADRMGEIIDAEMEEE